MWRLRFGRMWEVNEADTRGRLEIYIQPRDLWIGAYVTRNAVYLCPLPTLVFRISRGVVAHVGGYASSPEPWS